MAFDVEGAKRAGYTDAEIAGFLAQPQGGNRFADAPPEEPKKTASDTSSAADFADVPGGGSRSEVQPQRGTGGWGAWIDTSIQPSPNAATLLPFSVDPATKHARVAVPNAVRAILTEGPQGYLPGPPGQPQPRFETPAATINPDTGSLGVTPEAQAGAGLVGPSPLMFGGANRVFVPSGTFDRGAPLSQEFLQNPLGPSLSERPMPTPEGPVSATGVPPRETPPEMRAVPADAAAPASTQPAGAQVTPPHMLTMTPAEELAYRSTAEGQKLLETQQPGIADTRQLVTGVHPNSVETEQTAQAARELKALKLASPQLADEAFQLADANNSARQGHYSAVAGSKVNLNTAIEARQAQAEADLKATWANKTDTNPQAVLDTANQILSSEDGRRPAVRNAVNSVTKELYDTNGNLITDPQMLYGVRKHIDDMLSKEGAQTDPLAVRAKANLQALKDSLDGVISAGASGFRNYLNNFSTASRPIDAMRILQEREPDLYGTANRMEYGRFQRFMRDVVDARSSPGINPYKSLTDDQMQQLWALRDDLRRSNAAVELSRTAGSDTAQNLWDLARHGLSRGVGSAIGGYAGSLFGPLGTGVGASVGAQAGERFAAGRAEQRAYNRGQQLLYPNRLGPGASP